MRQGDKIKGKGAGAEYWVRRYAMWGGLIALAIALSVVSCALRSVRGAADAGAGEEPTQEQQGQQGQEAQGGAEPADTAVYGDVTLKGASKLSGTENDARAQLAQALSAVMDEQGISAPEAVVDAVETSGDLANVQLSAGGKQFWIRWNGDYWDMGRADLSGSRTLVPIEDASALASAIGEDQAADLSAAWSAYKADNGIAEAGQLDYASVRVEGDKVCFDVYAGDLRLTASRAQDASEWSLS